MPFDPTIPPDGAFATGAALRAQFNGLKDLIDAIPAGPAGPAGPEGPPFVTIQVGSVITGMPGTGAAVSVNVNGSIVELSFTIPAGDTGPMGEVSSAMLATEITGTARDPSTVSELSLAPGDPPTQNDFLQLVEKLNELIVALRR